MTNATLAAMATMDLRLGLGGPDLAAIFRAAVELGIAGTTPPEKLEVNNRSKKPGRDWVAGALGGGTPRVFAAWDRTLDHFVSLIPDRVVKVRASDFPRDVGRVLDLLERLPFEVASFAPLYDWLREFDYGPTGFADQHFPHGWACAFQGEGHRRLVSRRWLDFGPWRLVHGPGDLSLVQFHKLGVDAATALAQARPGHERMGNSDIGGFIASHYPYVHGLDGLYLAEQRQLRVVVHGREVSQREMLDACAARLYQALGPQRPLDSIAYVFMDEGAARAHLHELWLRELECWTIVEGREARLDLDYAPVPTPPAWAERAGG